MNLEERMSIISEEEDTLNPNAYVKNDPKSILKNLHEYSESKNVFKCKYKKNAHRITFEIPAGDSNSIDFQINALWNDTFEKVMMAVVISYFGSRGIEKSVNIIKK